VSHVYRALGVIGRVMIFTGVVLLLFVAYQLWGTGLHTRAAQAQLEDDLVDSLEAAQADDGTTTTTLPGGEGGPEDTTEVNGDGPPAARDHPVSMGDGKGLGETFGLSQDEIDHWPAPELSESFGYMSIPAIGSNWWMVEGVDLAWLRDGPGHFPGTSWPGQKGNAAFAGHRTTYGAPFHRIDELDPGDEILVETVQGEFRYEVMSRGELVDTDMPIADKSDLDSGHFIVNPNDSWILEDYGDNRITLMACHPKYAASQRIVVVGQLVGRVAPTTDPSVAPDAPEADPALLTEDLLSNDPTARFPAAMWGLAALGVYLIAWLIGRRWRKAKWPAYLVATPVFLVLLFVSFTYVERLLPAGY
jgi:sortase A